MAIDHEAVQSMEWKRARVSQKRQVTIPLKLYEQLDIKDEVEFALKDNMIVMRPVREYPGNDYFADLILADLIQQGFQGNELLAKFREKQSAVRGAVQHFITESGKVARQWTPNDDQTKELFGDVMEE
ncbi:AbrB/MazE/SpoVT family DNA-binding domain-containing protein [Paenibacillaceae bacterium WGS1546]|uniref:AbrB/MazE/SpoVT family DNA-binding domain-containing protein n=1 Tax=Cohnella sp. WGS1546 TaxID=3366810 RepID=UPI00372D5E6A